MTSRDRRAATLAVAVSLMLLPAGCSNSDDPEVPVIPTQGDSPGTDGATGATGDAAETPSPTSTTGVPELCSELASAGEVAQILQAPMQGETVRIYNDEFLSDSGRTGRLNCSYGVPTVPEGQTPPPVPLEVAVSGYVDAETASGRIDSTVDAAQAAAGQVQAQTVAGRDGFLLSDAEDISFVVADDVRTYVITLRHGVVPAAAEPVVLLELAAHLLGGSGATPAPTTT